MSKLSLNNSQNFNPIKPSHSKPKLDDSQDTPIKGKRESQSESSLKQLFDNQKKLTDSSSNIQDDHVESLSESIDESQSQKLLSRSKDVPTPLQMNHARSNVNLSQTVTIVNNPQHNVQLPVFQMPQVGNFDPNCLNLSASEIDRARFQFRTAMKEQYGGKPGESFKEMIKTELRPFLKELSKADSTFGRDVALQQTISNNAKQHIGDIVKVMGKKDEFGLLLSMFSQDELKQLLSETVGELREGKSRGFDDLSSKKQNFVNQVLSGITSNIGNKHRPDYAQFLDPQHPQNPGVQRPPSLVAKAQDDMLLTLKKHLQQNLSPTQLTQLKSLSDQDILTNFEPLIKNLGGNINALVLKAVSESHALVPPRGVQNFVTDLQAQDLNGNGVQVALQNLIANPGDGPSRTQLTNALQTHLGTLGNDHNTLWQLGVMSEAKLKATLQQLTAPVTLSDQDATWLVGEIRAMLPNHAGQGQSQLNGHNVPDTIQIGNKQYVPSHFVFESGYGRVFCYKNSQDDSDIVAVKMLLPNPQINPEQQHDEAVKELNLHRELQGPGGNQGVIGLKGAVHTTNGTLCMVQEFATGGDLNSFSLQLDQAVKNGALSSEGRKLLGLMMLKQSLESVKYLHDDREMLHSDLKSPNLMIGSDGHVKMIDFGTAVVGTVRNIEKRFVDNPNYLAPEQMLDDKTTVATKGSDIWSIGTLVHELLLGDLRQLPTYNAGFNTPIENELKDYAKDTNLRFMSKVPQQNITPQNRDVYELMEHLMMPQGEQRMNARDALNLPIFQDPRLESDAMKTLMRDFAQPLNPQQYQQRFDLEVQHRIDLYLQKQPNDTRPRNQIEPEILHLEKTSIKIQVEGEMRFERMNAQLQQLHLV